MMVRDIQFDDVWLHENWFEVLGEVTRGSGVPVTSTRYDGTIHGFFLMSSVLDQGKKAVAEAVSGLKAAFKK